MSNQPLLVIAAGGTGGHMFPAQALAEEMLARGWRVKLSTDQRGARYAGGFPEAVEREVVASATFARGGLLAKIGVPLKILAGVFGAWRAMRKDRPSVVAGFGGYPAIPAMAAAGMARIPRLIHEQNGVLGRVNQVFAKRVDVVACGTWPTEMPKGIDATYTGNPVRTAVLNKVGTPYTAPAFGPVRILVIGGSQGARVLSELVPDAIRQLPENLRFRVMVIQQARAEDMETVKAAYDAMEVESEISPFILDIPGEMADAQLVISRAGASSVAEITALGRPSILIPYPSAARDHQTANAKGLSEAGAAMLLPEKGLDSKKLSLEIMHLMNDDKAASQMAENAAGAGKPEAARTLAGLVEGLRRS